MFEGWTASECWPYIEEHGNTTGPKCLQKRINPPTGVANGVNANCDLMLAMQIDVGVLNLTGPSGFQTPLDWTRLDLSFTRARVTVGDLVTAAAVVRWLLQVLLSVTATGSDYLLIQSNHGGRRAEAVQDRVQLIVSSGALAADHAPPLAELADSSLKICRI